MSKKEILGICNEKYEISITREGDFHYLKLNNIEIDCNNVIRNVYFNNKWIHYTWYTIYDKYKESIIIKVEDIINNKEMTHHGFFSDRGFPQCFYDTGIDDNEYDLPYKIDMIKNIIIYTDEYGNEKEYHFEDLCMNSVKKIILKKAYE